MTRNTIGGRQATEETVSERVVSAVAAAREKSPLDLPPLYSVVDPDALDKLFASKSAERQTGPGRVTFVFDECEVIVHADGEVDATAPSDQTATDHSAVPAEETALD